MGVRWSGERRTLYDSSREVGGGKRGALLQSLRGSVRIEIPSKALQGR